MKIYISGKITNVDNWEDNFNAVEHHIKTKEYPISEVYNPVNFSREVQEKINRPEHSDYMRHDIAKLLECDAVYLIPHWQGSNGVEAELTVAKACEIPVYEIPDDDFTEMLKDYFWEVKRQHLYTRKEAENIHKWEKSGGVYKNRYCFDYRIEK